MIVDYKYVYEYLMRDPKRVTIEPIADYDNAFLYASGSMSCPTKYYSKFKRCMEKDFKFGLMYLKLNNVKIALGTFS